MKKGFALLLVEDDSNDIELFRHALEESAERAGVRVRLEVTRDGKEAIKYLSGQEGFAERQRFPFPDLIVLDLKMPGVTGLDVLAWLKGHEEYRRVPKIVLSSSSLERDVEEAYRLGANTFFQKPASLHELRELLYHLVSYWGRTQRPIIRYATAAPN
jgi:CheY-like chemotaxis protein